MKKIAIFGTGLIGGSIASGVKSTMPEIYIAAFDRPATAAKALEMNAADKIINSPEETAEYDIVFLCMPVAESLEYLEILAPLLKPGAVITDVSGVKEVFYKKWNTLKSSGFYVGGHPMTGKEKGGIENSDPILFENSVYILTNSLENNENFDLLLEIIHKLGARLKFLEPGTHDNITGMVSHLPQLLAVTLVNSASKKENGGSYLDFAAGGFRDMTRIASSDYTVWKPVLMNNKDAVLSAIERFTCKLDELESKLLNDDYEGIGELFEAARERRDEIPKNTKGFLNPLHDVFIYVKDEAGVLSKISTALYEASINIKDMELLKIREGSGGTFRMSFDSEKAAEQAKVIIAETGFRTK